MPLIGLQLNQFTLLLGVALFVFVMIKRIRRGFQQSDYSPRHAGSWRSTGRSNATPAVRETIGSARLRSADAPKAQEAWEVEMHRLARQLKADIDTKMRALEQLIQRADEACARLDTSLQRAESTGVYDESGVDSAPRPRTRIEEHRLAPIGPRQPPSGKRRLAREALSPTHPRIGEDLGDDPRFERIYALADAGFSATKIAGQIGSQVGEVELILSLRQTQT